MPEVFDETARELFPVDFGLGEPCARCSCRRPRSSCRAPCTPASRLVRALQVRRRQLASFFARAWWASPAGRACGKHWRIGKFVRHLPSSAADNPVQRGQHHLSRAATFSISAMAQVVDVFGGAREMDELGRLWRLSAIAREPLLEKILDSP